MKQPHSFDHPTPLSLVEEALVIPQWTLDALRALELDLIERLSFDYPEVMSALEEQHPDIEDLMEAITTLLSRLVALN